MLIHVVLSTLTLVGPAEAMRASSTTIEQQPFEVRVPRLDALLPPSAPLLAIRGTEIETAIRTADWPRAERLLAAEIDRQPGSRDLLVLIGRIFFLNDKPLNAAIALKKAEAIQPLDDDLRLTLALAYIRLGRGDWARPELERLAASRPEHAAYPYWIGRVDYDAGQYAAAVARFQQALARDPGFVRAHDNLGLCYESLDEPEKALFHYREAIRLNRQAATKSPWPPLNLAILLRQRTELDKAESLLREALHYDEKFANAHYQLGLVLEQRGQLGKAVTAFERAAALDAKYPEPHYGLARIYRRQGARERADQALATFLRLREAREARR
jgi:tetratricopeptide (TPR) repeat protein